MDYLMSRFPFCIAFIAGEWPIAHPVCLESSKHVLVPAVFLLDRANLVRVSILEEISRNPSWFFIQHPVPRWSTGVQECIRRKRRSPSQWLMEFPKVLPDPGAISTQYQGHDPVTFACQTSTQSLGLRGKC